MGSSRKGVRALKCLGMLGVGCLAYLMASCAIADKPTPDPSTQHSLASLRPLAPAKTLIMYEHGNFEGRAVEVRPPRTINLGEWDFNDKMSSFKIGEGLRVKFCSNNHCAGDAWHDSFELLGPYNSPVQKTANDWVSYVEVHDYDPATEPRVMLLGNGNFDFDRAGTFLPGQYSTADLKRNHIDTHGYYGAASGIVVPDGLSVKLYKGDFFEGEWTVLGPGQVDFSSGAFAHWNDQVASMEVFKTRTNSPVELLGTWENIHTHNEGFEFKIKLSKTLQTDKTTENEFNAAYTSSMEFGGELYGGTVSVSMSAGYALR